MIDAKLVKALRSEVGAGFADCKQALQEKDGDLVAAKEWLRARGVAIAGKKAQRTTQEGVISISSNEQQAVIVQVLAETDFVANNEIFRAFAKLVSDSLLQAGEAGCCDPTQVSVEGKSLDELRVEATHKIGENIQIGTCKFLCCKHQLYNYLHHNAKIGVIADIACGDEPNLGKQLCMHIASMKPKGISVDELDQEELDSQRQAFVAITSQSNKPEAVQEKIIAGKMNKFVAEHALLSQPYVWADDISVGKYLDQHKASITSFALLEIGK